MSAAAAGCVSQHCDRADAPSAVPDKLRRLYNPLYGSSIDEGRFSRSNSPDVGKLVLSNPTYDVASATAATSSTQSESDISAQPAECTDSCQAAECGNQTADADALAAKLPSSTGTSEVVVLLKELQATNTQLRQELKDAHAFINHCCQEVVEQKQQRHRLEQLNEAMREQMSSVQSMVKSFEQQVQALQQENKALRVQLEAATGGVVEGQEAMSNMQKHKMGLGLLQCKNNTVASIASLQSSRSSLAAWAGQQVSPQFAPPPTPGMLAPLPGRMTASSCSSLPSVSEPPSVTTSITSGDTTSFGLGLKDLCMVKTTLAVPDFCPVLPVSEGTSPLSSSTSLSVPESAMEYGPNSPASNEAMSVLAPSPKWNHEAHTRPSWDAAVDNAAKAAALAIPTPATAPAAIKIPKLAHLQLEEHSGTLSPNSSLGLPSTERESGKVLVVNVSTCCLETPPESPDAVAGCVACRASPVMPPTSKTTAVQCAGCEGVELPAVTSSIRSEQRSTRSVGTYVRGAAVLAPDGVSYLSYPSIDASELESLPSSARSSVDGGEELADGEQAAVQGAVVTCSQLAEYLVQATRRFKHPQAKSPSAKTPRISRTLPPSCLPSAPAGVTASPAKTFSTPTRLPSPAPLAKLPPVGPPNQLRSISTVRRMLPLEQNTVGLTASIHAASPSTKLPMPPCGAFDGQFGTCYSTPPKGRAKRKASSRTAFRASKLSRSSNEREMMVPASGNASLALPARASLVAAAGDKGADTAECVPGQRVSEACPPADGLLDGTEVQGQLHNPDADAVHISSDQVQGQEATLQLPDVSGVISAPVAAVSALLIGLALPEFQAPAQSILEVPTPRDVPEEVVYDYSMEDSGATREELSDEYDDEGTESAISFIVASAAQEVSTDLGSVSSDHTASRGFDSVYTDTTDSAASRSCIEFELGHTSVSQCAVRSPLASGIFQMVGGEDEEAVDNTILAADDDLNSMVCEHVELHGDGCRAGSHAGEDCQVDLCEEDVTPSGMEIYGDDDSYGMEDEEDAQLFMHGPNTWAACSDAQLLPSTTTGASTFSEEAAQQDSRYAEVDDGSKAVHHMDSEAVVEHHDSAKVQLMLASPVATQCVAAGCAINTALAFDEPCLMLGLEDDVVIARAAELEQQVVPCEPGMVAAKGEETCQEAGGVKPVVHASHACLGVEVTDMAAAQASAVVGDTGSRLTDPQAPSSSFDLDTISHFITAPSNNTAADIDGLCAPGLELQDACAPSPAVDPLSILQQTSMLAEPVQQTSLLTESVVHDDTRAVPGESYDVVPAAAWASVDEPLDVTGTTLERNEPDYELPGLVNLPEPQLLVTVYSEELDSVVSEEVDVVDLHGEHDAMDLQASAARATQEEDVDICIRTPAPKGGQVLTTELTLQACAAVDLQGSPVFKMHGTKVRMCMTDGRGGIEQPENEEDVVFMSTTAQHAEQEDAVLLAVSTDSKLDLRSSTKTAVFDSLYLDSESSSELPLIAVADLGSQCAHDVPRLHMACTSDTSSMHSSPPLSSERARFRFLSLMSDSPEDLDSPMKLVKVLRQQQVAVYHMACPAHVMVKPPSDSVSHVALNQPSGAAQPEQGEREGEEPSRLVDFDADVESADESEGDVDVVVADSGACVVSIAEQVSTYAAPGSSRTADGFGSQEGTEAPCRHVEGEKVDSASQGDLDTQPGAPGTTARQVAAELESPAIFTQPEVVLPAADVTPNVVPPVDGEPEVVLPEGGGNPAAGDQPEAVQPVDVSNAAAASNQPEAVQPVDVSNSAAAAQAAACEPVSGGDSSTAIHSEAVMPPADNDAQADNRTAAGKKDDCVVGSSRANLNAATTTPLPPSGPSASLPRSEVTASAELAASAAQSLEGGHQVDLVEPGQDRPFRGTPHPRTGRLLQTGRTRYSMASSSPDCKASIADSSCSEATQRSDHHLCTPRLDMPDCAGLDSMSMGSSSPSTLPSPHPRSLSSSRAARTTDGLYSSLSSSRPLSLFSTDARPVVPTSKLSPPNTTASVGSQQELPHSGESATLDAQGSAFSNPAVRQQLLSIHSSWDVSVSNAHATVPLSNSLDLHAAGSAPAGSLQAGFGFTFQPQGSLPRLRSEQNLGDFSAGGGGFRVDRIPVARHMDICSMDSQMLRTFPAWQYADLERRRRSPTPMGSCSSLKDLERVSAACSSSSNNLTFLGESSSAGAAVSEVLVAHVRHEAAGEAMAAMASPAKDDDSVVIAESPSELSAEPAAPICSALAIPSEVGPNDALPQLPVSTSPTMPPGDGTPEKPKQGASSQQHEAETLLLLLDSFSVPATVLRSSVGPQQPPMEAFSMDTGVAQVQQKAAWWSLGWGRRKQASKAAAPTNKSAAA